MKCCHVHKTDEGYAYCEREAYRTIGGNPFCTIHGIIVDARVSAD